MKKFFLLIYVLALTSTAALADNYNSEDVRQFAQEQQLKASNLEDKVKSQNIEIDNLNAKIVSLNNEIDQLNATTRRQRQVLDQWDSCELCVSLCKDKTKEKICSVN